MAGHRRTTAALRRLGAIRPVIQEHYVERLGCLNTTFVVPRDTDALCRLVELAVEPGGVIVDLGCGDGIPTVHAARSGARAVLGLDVNPDAVANARENARRAGLARDAVRVVQADMLAFLTDASARRDVFRRCGLAPARVDLLVTNPPYVPMGRPVSRGELDRLGQALGALDPLWPGVGLDRLAAIRTALEAAENGGPDGLRFVRALLHHGPPLAERLAWVQGSYSSPLVMLRILARSGLMIERAIAYAARFGRHAMARGTPHYRHLTGLRARKDAFFWSGSPDGPHWFLVLGFVARRAASPVAPVASDVRAAVEAFLAGFAAGGPERLAHCPVAVPFPMEIAVYSG